MKKNLRLPPKERKKQLEKLIEKAIINSNVGLTPNNDGNVIRLNIPMLTEERRKELMKTVHEYAEDGKISIRNIRRDVNEKLKTQKDSGLSEDNLKRALDNIQELTDEKIKYIGDYWDAVDVNGSFWKPISRIFF